MTDPTADLRAAPAWQAEDGPMIALSASVSLCPEMDAPEHYDGTTILWTFEVNASRRTGPGIYRIEFVRNLTTEEVRDRDKRRAAVNAAPALLAEIDRLRASDARMREALEPFSEAARMAGIGPASVTMAEGSRSALHTARVELTIEDFARANAAIHGATTDGR